MVILVPEKETRGPDQAEYSKVVVPSNVTVVPVVRPVISRVVPAGTVMPLRMMDVHEFLPAIAAEAEVKVQPLDAAATGEAAAAALLALLALLTLLALALLVLDFFVELLLLFLITPTAALPVEVGTRIVGLERPVPVGARTPVPVPTGATGLAEAGIMEDGRLACPV